MAILKCVLYVGFVMGYIAMATGNCQCDQDNLTVRCSSMSKTEFQADDLLCGSTFTNIDLSKNTLQEYPQVVQEYKIVNISDNRISQLKSEAVQYVEKLDMSMNVIESIELGKSFPKLLILNVSDNALGGNSDDFFSGVCDLMYIDISGNMIESLDSITKCRKLIFLVASRNVVMKVPSELLEIKELELLDMSMNRLKHISNIPKSVKMLNLKQNDISVIDTESLGKLVLLKLLNLEANKITKIDSGALSSLASLEILDLSGNKLQKISSDLFNGLRVLKSLMIPDNYIDFVANDSFSDLSELRQLVMDVNLLVNIPALRLGKNVNHVSLMVNYIEKVDISALKAIFYGSESPRVLNLALNKFRGDDPGWKDVLSVFDWQCASESLISHVENFLTITSSRSHSHKIDSSDCACALFMKNLWNIGVCISDIATINDQHWLRDAKASVTDEENYKHDEL